jgi:eukaryotic-like serine/threonine-protein kinase
MPAPTSIDEFLELVRKSGVLDDNRLDAHMSKLRDKDEVPADVVKLAAVLVRDGILTNFQAEQLVQGKWKRFTIGKYRVLERLGSGGMGSVFLCEHIFMCRRVAVKVLPSAKAAEPSLLARFYREARAVAAVDHPNIVHAYDIDQDETLHFIVMEYVDGPSLQEIVRRSGPLGLERACHYISQAALGLDHASAAGLVHRDIKPGNILVDCTGVVKILDMGLARFFNDEEDLLTRKYDDNVLGTADYLAPEQADDSHTVDVRADIYSLGGTFYFLLTGKTPFGEGNVPQKLMWHRTRHPKPVSAFRGDVPDGVQAVIDRMMAKEPQGRFQSPHEIVEALARWTQNSIPPPAENEMPQLSLAATGTNSSSGSPGSSGSWFSKKQWQVSGSPSPTKPPSSGGGTGLAGPEHPRQKKTTEQGQRPAAGLMPKQKAAVWSAVGPDTADPSVRGDTPPLVPAKPRTAKRPATLVTAIRNRKTLLLSAVGLLLTLGVLGLAIFCIFFLGRP